jgi:hypothetical protein
MEVSSVPVPWQSLDEATTYDYAPMQYTDAVKDSIRMTSIHSLKLCSDDAKLVLVPRRPTALDGLSASMMACRLDLRLLVPDRPNIVKIPLRPALEPRGDFKFGRLVRSESCNRDSLSAPMAISSEMSADAETATSVTSLLIATPIED